MLLFLMRFQTMKMKDVTPTSECLDLHLTISLIKLEYI